MGKVEQKGIIGVVGGVGPYAGLDLVRKIFDQTKANSDQEHLSVALLSLPATIADRTSFLLDQGTTNPAFAIVEVVRRLELIGARVVGIPCNSAHARSILDVIHEELRQAESAVKLIDMIEEVARFIRENDQAISTLGVLSTTGTYQTKVYLHALQQDRFKVVLPDAAMQESIQEAIYHPQFGIKAQSNPVSETARRAVLASIDHLVGKGAEAVILGCTELPLAVAEKRLDNAIIIDPTLILARALIRAVAPAKLKPLTEW